jgi:predicted PurR-regulated permease PerM
MPIGLSLALLVLLCAALAVVGSVLTAPTLGDQVERLRQALPTAIAQLRGRLPPELSGATALPNARGAVRASSGFLVSALGNSIEVLSALVVIFFVAIYGAAQPQQYVDAVLAITPAQHRERVGRVLDCVRHNLTRWLVGRLIAMTFVGVTTTIAFHFLHLPLAIVLGVLAGLLTFIEYAGAVASAIPPLILALAESPVRALWVLAIFTALHVIEGYVLTPLLARAAVHLPPAITLSTQVIFSVLVGPLGLTFSTPLLVLGISTVKAWRNQASSQATAPA